MVLHSSHAEIRRRLRIWKQADLYFDLYAAKKVPVLGMFGRISLGRFWQQKNPQAVAA